VIEEIMEERRQLFLEEMARIRERERHLPEDAQVLVTAQPAQKAPVPVLPVRPTLGTRPRAIPVAFMALCLVLVFPIWGYVQHQAALNPAGGFTFAPGGQGPDSPEWRLARLQRVRIFFGLPDIVAVSRDQNGMSFILQPQLSHASVLAQAQRIKVVLTGHIFPPRGPQTERVGLCSGDPPCLVAVIHTPGPGEKWYVTDGSRIVQ
jgi:hypothetical protein